MIRVLFVCLGNICRSPLAQGIFEKKIEENNWNSFISADSAGVSGWHEGEKPHAGSIQAAKANSVQIENQRSRPVTYSDRNEFEYFIAMDRSNAQSLIHEFGIPEDRVFTLRSFDPGAGSQDVPDPYGGSANHFHEVFEIIQISMDHFLRYLKEKHSELS